MSDTHIPAPLPPPPHFSGGWQADHLHKVLYATDASVYRELPQAVATPKSEADIQALVRYAQTQQTSLIPRAAGTSLAGQCVGNGIVVDVGRHLNQILEFNEAERWVRVQPGVVRNELNAYLREYGLFFSPITATANRAMIGGMVGNNSSGTTSIAYGVTRDKVIALRCVLSDGSVADFSALTAKELNAKTAMDTLEGQLYRQLLQELSKPEVQTNIREHFPKADVHRRNTGYAVDAILDSQPFLADGPNINLCQLLTGSEGTLAFTTEITLKLDPLPPPHDVVLAAHFDSIDASMRATQIAMRHAPSACELMDKVILDCTKDNIEQRKNRFFVDGDPAAVLMVEFRATSPESARQKAEALISDLEVSQLGYAFPLILPPHTGSVWQLRSAGLGLLANIPGDKKAVACIEDTAVSLEVLPDYIREFGEMMAAFGQKAVYYAHAGAGEIHLRPILDLKKATDVQLFYDISKATAELVKKYGGSLSGEHGDGRVRAPFIPLVLGEENYQLFRRIKQQWDPHNIFNPGKIVDTAPMNESLRYQPEQETPDFDTIFDFSATGGILRLAEKCNGSGDCRKLPLSGGTMCPSYQATRNEKDTTRARANTLREFLTKNTGDNPFDHQEIKEVMDLCLSCKGCTSECPSNVDMSSLKAEFLHQYYRTHGVPFRSKVIANISKLNRLGSYFPGLSNFFLGDSPGSHLLKRLLHIAPKRSLPKLQPTNLWRWYQRHYSALAPPPALRGRVYLFCDEFTNYNDAHIGITAIKLLHRLGYQVNMLGAADSGRAQLSKGLLPAAKKQAIQNVQTYAGIISADTPLLGIEPSAILSFRDEYPRLVPKNQQDTARQLGQHCLMIDTFLQREAAAGRITAADFGDAPAHILLHGHCHQKALADVTDTAFLLGLPKNHTVEVIPSGCCGMAGSFGYEKEHYELSMQVGELVLFPAVRASHSESLIAAPGTSCRHQIKDGTRRTALHPVEVLWRAMG